ncbi:hypothetical protein [Streptosporangium saharense]|uniref:hypothetical protein n=1 Tax=Streptosporangium saharense TaxID=1706840 RepID=UPI0036B7CFB0
MKTDRGIDAVTLVKEIDRRTAENPIRNAVVAKLREDRFTLEDLRRLLEFEVRLNRTELAAYALAASRFTEKQEDVYCLKLQEMASRARVKLLDCARVLPIEPRTGADGQTEGFTAYAYGSYLSWLALNASRAGLGAASLVDVRSYFSTSEELGAWLRNSRIGAPEEAVAFYGGEPEGLSTSAVAFIQAGLDAGDDPDEALRLGDVMRDVMGYFWRVVSPG